MVFLRLLIASLLFLYSFTIVAQNYTISGHVYDAKTNNAIENVNIIANELNTISDKSGSYKLILSSKKINIQATAVGYSSYFSNYKINRDTVINIYLKVQNNDIKTVTINADKIYLHRSESIIDLPIAQIQKIPSLAGEQDILKAIQLTPGIQAGTEGSTGLNVRGGSNSQNLILLDGIPIYNASHLFGFMSVFNTDAISKVKIYKGGFPAYYGGRLASVIRIDLKEGNNKKPIVKINTGLISTKIFIESPLYKDKTSFIVSGRTSYLNLFYKIPNLFSTNDNLQNLGLYETNIKIKHKFTNKTKLVYGFYLGKDYYKYGTSKVSEREEKFTSLESIEWGNIINYLNFEQKINKNAKINLLLAQNKYSYNIYSEQEEIYYSNQNKNKYTKTELNSSISDYQARLNLNLNFKNNEIDFGSEYFYHTFLPEINTYKKTDSLENTNNQKSKIYYSNELSIYLNNNFKIKNKLFANIGLRYSTYQINDTTYQIPEPRISLNYTLNQTTAIKLAITGISQFSYMLSNNTVGMPKDIWVPATKRTSYQTAYQYSCGINKKINKYNSNLGVEFFYKKMNNLIDYKDNIYYDLDFGNWEGLIETNGKGRAYGSEIWLHKQQGKFTGWLAYTLLFSERRFENINNNNWYPHKYERRHDFSVTANYKISNNIELSSTFVFASGFSTTMPVGRYNTQNGYDNIFYYESRNNQRMPAYHRLDIGIRFIKEQKNWQRTWEFSLYNAYNHLNTYYLTLNYSYKNTDQDYSIYKRTLFPIIPSISYSFKF